MSCGSKCCRRFDYHTWYVQLSLRDILRIAQGLGENIEKVVENYIKLIGNNTYKIITLKTVDRRCIFLSDNGCTIQNFKPIACRTYPVYIPGTYADPDCPLSQYPELLEEENNYVPQYIKEFEETRRILEEEKPNTEKDLITVIKKHLEEP